MLQSKNNKGDRCPVRKNFSDRLYLSSVRNTNIMAVKSVKQPVEPITTPKPALNESVDDAFKVIATDIDIESMIADQLLDDIDWAKVRSAILRKAPAKLFAWLTSGNNTPINISQFPELTALPISDDEGKAA